MIGFLLPTYASAIQRATKTEFTVTIIISSFILFLIIITMVGEQLTVTHQWWHLLMAPLRHVFAMKIISRKEMGLWLKIDSTLWGNVVWCYWGNTRIVSICWTRKTRNTFLYLLEKADLYGCSKTLVIQATAQEHVSEYAQVQIRQMGLHLKRNALRNGEPEESTWEEDSYSYNK